MYTLYLQKNTFCAEIHGILFPVYLQCTPSYLSAFKFSVAFSVFVTLYFWKANDNKHGNYELLLGLFMRHDDEAICSCQQWHHHHCYHCPHPSSLSSSLSLFIQANQENKPRMITTFITIAMATSTGACFKWRNFLTLGNVSTEDNLTHVQPIHLIVFSKLLWS